MARAIVRFNDKTKHVVVLCPMGHLITARAYGADYAGSSFEADLVAHQAGRETWMDRAATDCRGAGHIHSES